jgi:hypothetical protein
MKKMKRIAGRAASVNDYPSQQFSADTFTTHPTFSFADNNRSHQVDTKFQIREHFNEISAFHDCAGAVDSNVRSNFQLREHFNELSAFHDRAEG